jgi:hypothetical protein
MIYLIAYIICSYILYIILGRIYIYLDKSDADVITVLFWIAPLSIFPLIGHIIPKILENISFTWLGNILWWICCRLYKISSILLGS